MNIKKESNINARLYRVRSSEPVVTAPGFMGCIERDRDDRGPGWWGSFDPGVGSGPGGPGSGGPWGSRFRGSPAGVPGGPPGGPGPGRIGGGPIFRGPSIQVNWGGWTKLHRKIHFLVCTRAHRARARARRGPRAHTRKHRNVDISGPGLIRSVDRLRVRDSTANLK